MKHITDVQPAKWSNFDVKCTCGHISHIAGDYAFAQESAYQHVKDSIEMETFTRAELKILSGLLLKAPQFSSLESNYQALYNRIQNLKVRREMVKENNRENLDH